MTDKSKLLKLALRGNAVFSTLCGLTSLAATSQIATLTGIPASAILQNGVSLLLFATWIGWMSSRTPIPTRQAAVVVVLDAIWVVGSIAALIAPPSGLTLAGKWTIGIVALAVGTLADMQFFGIRRLKTS